jgi:hypothetical protein
MHLEREASTLNRHGNRPGQQGNSAGCDNAAAQRTHCLVMPAEASSPIKFSYAVDLAREHYKRTSKPTSQHTYRWHAASALEWFGERDILSITKRDIQAWIVQQRTIFSPATLAHQLSFLSRCFCWRGMLESNSKTCARAGTGHASTIAESAP